MTSLNHNDLTDGGTDMSGIVQLAEWMKQTRSLRTLKCAPRSLNCRAEGRALADAQIARPFAA